MANVRKKISELTALNSASLDTTIVGVDGGTTYKIELDTLADAVTSRVNILDRDRLNSLESVTSSFESKGRSVISSSAQITNLGFVSSSVDISALNSFTSSQSTLNTAFTNGINARLQTSSFNDFSSSVNQRILDATNEQSFNGLISGSSQLTSSYDERYVLSGSITQTTWDNIENKPSGIVSQSTDLSSLNQFTSSQSTLNTAFQNGVNARLQTSSFNDFSASIHTEILAATNEQSFNGLVSGSSQLTSSLDTRYASSASYLTSLNGAISSSAQILNGSGIYSSSAQLPIGLVSGSSQLTSSYDIRYTLSGSVSAVPSGTISGSSQLTASLDTRYAASGSIGGAAPAGTVSGSSQLTSSLDLRYLVTGSVTSSILQLNTFTASNANTSLNTFTSSLNIWTSSVATTGSNSFNGNQTITGSLNVSSVAVISSSFTANSSSLTLNSGSNLYIQNNGIVEITGSLRVSGSVNIITTSALQIGTGSGDEGGEIQLAKAVTNTTLTGSAVTVDVYRDRVRIFEQGGDVRGVHIDLSKAPGGVAGELLWKASGIVNAGTFVTLDNIKATLTSSSNRGLSVAAVSTNFSANISAYHAYSGGIAGISANNQSITTTPTTSLFGWNFPAEADGSYYNILDKTNNRFYRITLMIGASFNNNFISIERLY